MVTQSIDLLGTNVGSAPLRSAGLVNISVGQVGQIKVFSKVWDEMHSFRVVCVPTALRNNCLIYI